MSETPADPEQNPTEQNPGQNPAEPPKDGTPEGFPFDPRQDPPQEAPAVPHQENPGPPTGSDGEVDEPALEDPQRPPAR
ncbi:hypothetical protein [Arthrobacter sp. NPDC057013]|uniref:hypothetical protein n=1 Tax=Arthrobacter sp. NPDC057013 TaxID=3345999 RepID=UPI00362B4075